MSKSVKTDASQTVFCTFFVVDRNLDNTRNDMECLAIQLNHSQCIDKRIS
jgi:hypothetical protein